MSFLIIFSLIILSIRLFNIYGKPYIPTKKEIILNLKVWSAIKYDTFKDNKLEGVAGLIPVGFMLWYVWRISFVCFFLVYATLCYFLGI